MFSQTEKHALSALFRCARYRRTADVSALSLRVPGSPKQLRDALRSLEAHGLVNEHDRDSFRLTMSGLATAAALLPPVVARSQRRPALRVVVTAA